MEEKEGTMEMTLAAAAGMRPCGECGVLTDEWYVADNNYLRTEQVYCSKCEEIRSDKYGCALIRAEGAMCQDGACGCDGAGVYL
jgi:hypothetical protein